MMELTVGVVIFSMLLVIIFMFFRTGTRAFQTAMQRQGVHSDALRCMDTLVSEMRRTAADSVTSTERSRTVRSQVQSRDAICFAGVDDPNETDSTNNYTTDGHPLWSRYWIFYATTDADSGHFVRCLVRPLQKLLVPSPMAGSDFVNLIHDDPAANRYGGATPVVADLAKTVLHFSAKRHLGDIERIDLELTLQEPRLLRTAGNEVRQDKWDLYQLRTTIKPQNTYPEVGN